MTIWVKPDEKIVKPDVLAQTEYVSDSPNSETNLLLTKSVGKRKTRRMENEKFLVSLTEDEEVGLLAYGKSSFQKLLEDEEALQFWNQFIELDEKEQEVIITGKL